MKVRELTQREGELKEMRRQDAIDRREKDKNKAGREPCLNFALAKKKGYGQAGPTKSFTGEGINPWLMANVETNIQQRIRLALGTRDDVRLFRNQVGQLPDPRTGRPVQFGLAKGSADIVGWTTKTITEDDVGKSYAIFTSIEVKTATGRLTGLQQNWLHTVQTAGGLAGVARSQRTLCKSSPPNPRHPLEDLYLIDAFAFA